MKTNNPPHWCRMTLCLCLSMGCLISALSAPAQQARTIEHNIAPPTPEQQAQIAEMFSLDHAAAGALHAGDDATAEADAQEVLSLGQDSGVAQEVLAEALDAQGKTQEALQEYQTMANQGWNPPRVWLPYALLLLKTGQWPQAMAAYQQALAWMPEMKGSALPHLDLTFRPDDPQSTELAMGIHVALGLTYSGGCDWAGNSEDDKALDQYQQALALAPNWGIANYYYGYGLRKMGRRMEAQAAFKKAASLDQGNVDVKAAAEAALAGR